ncbi:hypothetical protein SAMD00019534_116940 [Acytostelium subglobosum LB1]|uniref:hypothetical protein n=1 Tax=Acytostelium subglobosum LB1 TaxID=1410327 RepID=UPI000644F6CD|nr:hypothetical protein SAMD00019534_116940 [Acytostelium subglobosum LB1]GAM28518.1 hypothetical protein SAMD00019534_116940 [Acytostelium subglobosum LB1]|eukprot:XP_012748557.1 hypothetical protein SAMD00019534_116940 [Acytostelium subglobosum LB1]
MSTQKNDFQPIQDTVKIKPPRKLNYEYLQPLAAAPIIGLIKFVGRDRYPRVNAALYGLTVGAAFIHGAYMLNKSYGNLDER